MAVQILFFMTPDDEREIFRKIERHDLELWPELCDRGYTAPKLTADLAGTLDGPAYYFAVGDVQAFNIKRGQNRGQWKIDEVASPVLYFNRSLPDENGELRSGYFWTELESRGDLSRLGGKPDSLRRLFLDLQDFVKVRYRKSKPVKGQTYFIGPHAARSQQEGLVLREAGRKGDLVVPHHR